MKNIYLEICLKQKLKKSYLNNFQARKILILFIIIDYSTFQDSMKYFVNSFKI